MAYIPSDTEWYIAEIVLEIQVEGDPRNVVHRNLTLIRAHTPEQALEKASDVGKQSETGYRNRSGQSVTIRFRGLSSLNVIHEKLEHGAELRYIESVSIQEKEIAELVKPKLELEVFRDLTPCEGPDYGSEEITRQALELMARDRENRS